MTTIGIKGLDELLRRMQEYPQMLKTSLEITMQAALLTLNENVPPYPPPPEGSTYKRTGTDLPEPLDRVLDFT